MIDEADAITPRGTYKWGLWSAWTSCSTTCDMGTMTRYRVCWQTVPLMDGATQRLMQRSPAFDVQVPEENCPRGSYKSSFISSSYCNDDVQDKCPSWTDWSGWSKCGCENETHGIITRTRKCQKFFFNIFAYRTVEGCPGSEKDEKVCNDCAPNTMIYWRNKFPNNYWGIPLTNWGYVPGQYLSGQDRICDN